ncbi:MAG: fused MFS/spermidine synthase, partial [Nitrospinota bacterium]
MMKFCVLVLFFGSGMTGLIYQVLWTKLLTLTFGVTFLAVSTVLTTFFGGLALGSFLGGRWIDKHGIGLKWYGLAELGIGLYALLFLQLLDLNNSVYVEIARMLPMSFSVLSILKFLLAAVLLILPTTLMGTTLPVLSKTLAHSRPSFAKDVGGLYTINTIGAVFGALATTFFLIPGIGINATIYLVGGVNIALGLIALILNRSYKEDSVNIEYNDTPETKIPLPQPDPSFFKYIVWLFAISGYTALVYEVIWTRILGFILTGTIFAFTIVLATFLFGIAAGSFVFSRFLDKIRNLGTLITTLAVVEILIGITSVALLNVFEAMPRFDFYSKIDSTPAWGEFIYLNFFTCFIALSPPAFLFGATFPLVCKIYNRSWRDVGTNIGDIYSVNTVGGILGSFTGGFILIPFVGMQNSVVFMGLINIGLGAVLLYRSPFLQKKKRTGYLLLTASASLVLFLSIPGNMPKALHQSFLHMKESILYYKEGPTATVMIAKREGRDYFTSNKRLWVNGNMATAAFYEGLQINRFQGVLPMVLHPDPKDVVVVCFGSGTTFGTLSQFDVHQVDNVEISRSVIGGAHNFKNENRDVLNNPVSNIIIDDGRSYLEVTEKKYDVMTMEPMHPSLAGVVNLYTKRYYELLKSHLKKDGLVSQWIPLYSLSVEDVRMMVKTFQSVFPHVTVWFAAEDIFMVGSPEKRVQVDYDRLVQRISKQNIKSLLREIDLDDPQEFLNTYIMNEEQVRRYTDGAKVLTDNWPVIEYTGPKSLNHNTVSPNIAEFVKFKEKITPVLILDGKYDRASLEKAIELNMFTSRNYMIGKAYLSAQNIPKAIPYLKQALKVNPADSRSLH